MTDKENQVILSEEGQVAVLRLGAAEEAMIILSEARMDSLTRAVEQIRAQAAKRSIKGLVIAGAHPGLFCAGADINVIKTVQSKEEGYGLAKKGQELFQAIDDLPITTVAAISGACVGGGCELALACDFRVLSSSGKTKIGLPEVKLGILPGFGGTQRLPRLIGLRAALDLILKGRVLPANVAKKIGLADELVDDLDGSELLDRALAIAAGKRTPPPRKLPMMDSLLVKTGFGRSFIKKKVTAQISKTAGEHYPAPLKAVEAVFCGLDKGLTAGYEQEAKYLGELIVTPECKSLVHIFFLTEDASKVGKSARTEIEAASVGVIGAGTMGAGIAASFLMSGYPVVLVDTVEEARQKGRDRIARIVQGKRSFSEEKKKQCLKRLTLTDDLGKFAGATLVVEAIIEDLEIKKTVLSNVEGMVGDDCILASNTSSLSISDIAQGLQRPEQLIGMHFFNPAEKMQLVELVCGQATSPNAIAISAALTDSLGKYPVVVQDVPGFLVNRILTPYLVEAAYLLSEGFSVSEIDKAAKKFGMPMGPLRLLDEIGLDVAAKVSEIIEAAYGMRMRGPKFAEELVAKGLYGKKSGKGFYVYSDSNEKPSINPEINKLLAIGGSGAKPKIPSDHIGKRLIYAFLNEAVRCLDEEVSGIPGAEAAGQVDLASVMGTGFAPFRGGVINYADSIGAKQIQADLQEFSKIYGERFSPWTGIKKRAEAGSSFREAVG